MMAISMNAGRSTLNSIITNTVTGVRIIMISQTERFS